MRGGSKKAKGRSEDAVCARSDSRMSRSAFRAHSFLPFAFLLLPSQSALDPAGPQAGRIIGLWWLMFYVTGAIFLIVIFFLVVALLRKRRTREGDGENAPITRPDANVERRMSRVVLACVAATVL